MSEAPERPPAVPSAAQYRIDLDKWEVVGLDGAGKKAGEAQLYRPDGSLYMRCQFLAGVEDGPFSVYHPSGELARQGRYSGGELDGPVVARVATSGEGEPLRSCCVPEPAVEMRTAWERGQLLSERFFDAEGRALLSDGSLCPPLPPGLPADAEYDEGGGRWMVAPAPGASPPLLCFHRQDGSLDEEALIVEGWKTFSRLYALDGTVKSEQQLGAAGRRHGPFRRRFIDGETSPFLDPRIAEERGRYLDDQPIGAFSYHDESGALLRTVEYGAAPGGCPNDDVFTDDSGDADAFLARVEVLAQQGCTGLALLAAARAAARRREAEVLVEALARYTVALAEEPALLLATKAANPEAADKTADKPYAPLLTALVAGGDPAELLRTLAAITVQPRAALDFAEASLLLAPDRPAGFLTRALARLEVGEDGGALADARQLEPVSPESAEFLRMYARTLFPEWAFWPARENFSGDAAEIPEGVPDGPAQPLSALVAQMKIYATRLQLLREAVIARAPKRARAAWLPPALPELLPDGPVTLRRYEATITDETDDGPETSTVDVDETLAPDELASLGVSSLMKLARGQWAALTWLCWSAGLARVALPTTLDPPAAFPLAAVTGITRYFRVQDAIITGGLRSRTGGVPGFPYHGTDIDELPRPVAEIALEECREVRALFLWLLSPENHSPFQSDLRLET